MADIAKTNGSIVPDSSDSEMEKGPVSDSRDSSESSAPPSKAQQEDVDRTEDSSVAREVEATEDDSSSSEAPPSKPQEATEDDLSDSSRPVVAAAAPRAVPNDKSVDDISEIEEDSSRTETESAPVKEASPEPPVKEASPEPPVEVPTPEPVKEATPEPPVKEATPEPVREPTPEPVKEATPEPVREPTPEPPVKEATPEPPVKEATPEPVKQATPEPVKPSTPEAVKMRDSPVGSPRLPRGSSVQTKSLASKFENGEGFGSNNNSPRNSPQLQPKRHNMSTKIDKDSVRKAYEDVRCDENEVEWAVFQYDDNNQIFLKETGVEFNDFKKHFDSEMRGYGYIKIRTGDEMSKRSKFVFLTWTGQKVSIMKKAKMGTDKGLVKDVVQNFSVELQLGNLAELNHDFFKSEVDKAAGARYGTGLREM